MKILNDSETTFQYASKNGLKSLVKQAQARLNRQRMAVALTEAEIRELDAAVVKENAQLDAFTEEMRKDLADMPPATADNTFRRGKPR